MMGKLVARDSKVNRPFKSKIYQSQRRGQSGIFYETHKYDRVNYKTDIEQIVVTEEISIDRIEVDQGMNKIIGEKILEAM